MSYGTLTERTAQFYFLRIKRNISGGGGSLLALSPPAAPRIPAPTPVPCRHEEAEGATLQKRASHFFRDVCVGKLTPSASGSCARNARRRRRPAAGQEEEVKKKKKRTEGEKGNPLPLPHPWPPLPSAAARLICLGTLLLPGCGGREERRWGLEEEEEEGRRLPRRWGKGTDKISSACLHWRGRAPRAAAGLGTREELRGGCLGIARRAGGAQSHLGIKVKLDLSDSAIGTQILRLDLKTLAFLQEAFSDGTPSYSRDKDGSAETRHIGVHPDQDLSSAVEKQQ
ncbi:Hypothetical predicted protein [Podarcis lilfordi]|uniref:Uncharacterized protein n=1 Tax=Podarcis lilfordi TaxID=74358 RepID=A0AA35KDM8_9SAUR|nr:Hypothetical predicted protein [Podarcis lilfordi]